MSWCFTLQYKNSVQFCVYTDPGVSQNTKRISIPNNYTVTLKSTRQYDTIIIVGQVGGKVIFDVIPLHPTNSCAVHLGEINSIITNATASTVEIKIDSYAVCMAVGYGNLSIS